MPAMSNIVVIMSSPRKDGNSSTIAKYMAEGAMGLSTNIIEAFNLNDMKVFRSCDHCDKCKGTGKCIIEDDLTPVLSAIDKCDALIVTTPLYFGNSSSLVNVLVDRMYYLMGPDFKPVSDRKCKFSAVITYDYDREGADALMDYFKKTFERFGFTPCDGIVYNAKGQADAAKNDELLYTMAYNLGHEIGS